MRTWPLGTSSSPMISSSTRSNSGYHLYRMLLSKLSGELSREQIAQWPGMFRGEQGSLIANESQKIRYQDFLRSLKQVCHLLGYDETMLGTHSLRRGSVTDQFQCVIPDQVIPVASGHWKSAAFLATSIRKRFYRSILRVIQTMEVWRAWGGGRGERERTSLRQNHSTSTALFVKTTRQAQHTNRSTLQVRSWWQKYATEKFIRVGWIH